MTDATEAPVRMQEVTCVASHPVDLNTGRTLEPGEKDQANVLDPHNKALLDSGDLITDPIEAPNVAEPTPDTTEAPADSGSPIEIFENRSNGQEA